MNEHNEKRDNRWLESKLNCLVSKYFSDIEIKNDLYIGFGRKSSRQLGKISKQRAASFGKIISGRFDSVITINSHFKNLEVPEYVVEGTIIHELCHYAHGFSSPLPQLSRYPHQGGIVKREMFIRGAGDIYHKEKKWLRDNWPNFLKKVNHN